MTKELEDNNNSIDLNSIPNKDILIDILGATKEIKSLMEDLEGISKMRKELVEDYVRVEIVIKDIKLSDHISSVCGKENPKNNHSPRMAIASLFRTELLGILDRIYTTLSYELTNWEERLVSLTRELYQTK